MAEKIQQNQFDEVGVNPFNAPIPGEALTASPDTMIPEDDVTPVDMDGDGEPDTETSTKPIIKPDSLSKSLLARVDNELESKVKEATEEEVEE